MGSGVAGDEILQLGGEGVFALGGLGTVSNSSLSQFNRGSSTADEAELVAETQEEYRVGARKRRGLKPLPVLEHFAERLAAIGEGTEDNYLTVLSKKLKAHNVKVPSVVIEYTGLCVNTQALIGSAGIPTVGNQFLNLIKAILCIKTRTVKYEILKDIHGVVHPGRCTLLLGPPSSGKSTFLKLLAGRLKPNGNLQISGDIKYNGHTPAEFVVERTAGFVSQLDNHIPSLSVMETLEFAYVCQSGFRQDGFHIPDVLRAARERDKKAGYSSQAHLDSSTTEEDEEEFQKLMDETFMTGVRTLTIMRAFGISHTKNTPVGDSTLRGGGERKRVTTAEMLVGPRKILMMDEISTGLDSATLYNIIQRSARATAAMELTTVISLLQPPPEVFNLFADLILMTEGRVIYHGPVSEVLPFFASLGFTCPPRKDVPSFLQEVTTAMGQMDYASAALRASRDGPAAAGADLNPLAKQPLLVPIQEIAAAFWRDTAAGRAMRAELARPFDKSKSHPAALVKTKYALSPWEAIWVVSQRQLLMVAKDPVLVKGRLAQVLIISLIVSSLFLQLGDTYAESRTFFGASFLCVMFMAMGAMPQLSIAIATKSVWYKFRDNNFYPAYAHAIGGTLAVIPMAMVDCALFSLVTYFMIGFYMSAGHFFTFYVILVAISVNSAALFRMIAHIAPDGVSANAYGGFVLLILIIMSGFSIVRGSIPNYWIWAYYLSPFSWALRAVVINEMTSPAWQGPDPSDPSSSIGVTSLLSFDFFTETYWIWAGVGYLFASTFIWAYGSSLALALLCHLLTPDTAEADPPASAPASSHPLSEAGQRTTIAHLSGAQRVARVPDEGELDKARNAAARPMSRAATATAPSHATATPANATATAPTPPPPTLTTTSSALPHALPTPPAVPPRSKRPGQHPEKPSLTSATPSSDPKGPTEPRPTPTPEILPTSSAELPPTQRSSLSSPSPPATPDRGPTPAAARQTTTTTTGATTGSAPAHEASSSTQGGHAEGRRFAAEHMSRREQHACATGGQILEVGASLVGSGFHTMASGPLPCSRDVSSGGGAAAGAMARDRSGNMSRDMGGLGGEAGAAALASARKHSAGLPVGAGVSDGGGGGDVAMVRKRSAGPSVSLSVVGDGCEPVSRKEGVQHGDSAGLGRRSGGTQSGGMSDVIPFQPVTLVFQDLRTSTATHVASVQGPVIAAQHRPFRPAVRHRGLVKPNAGHREAEARAQARPR
ncbi:MAG: hypothetical protein WDW36_001233 [Sanguina aurantia]